MKGHNHPAYEEYGPRCPNMSVKEKGSDSLSGVH